MSSVDSPFCIEVTRKDNIFCQEKLNETVEPRAVSTLCEKWWGGGVERWKGKGDSAIGLEKKNVNQERKESEPEITVKEKCM